LHKIELQIYNQTNPKLLKWHMQYKITENVTET